MLHSTSGCKRRKKIEKPGGGGEEECQKGYSWFSSCIPHTWSWMTNLRLMFCFTIVDKFIIHYFKLALLSDFSIADRIACVPPTSYWVIMPCEKSSARNTTQSVYKLSDVTYSSWSTGTIIPNSNWRITKNWCFGHSLWPSSEITQNKQETRGSRYDSQ